MQLDLTLFRVTQEALTNAVRHANATTVEVKLHPTKKGLMLEIIDNGIGIDENKISSNKSLGIIGMRERIRQFNGSLEITSLQPKGTNVTVLVQT
jgi:signal transduction histidine kinase